MYVEFNAKNRILFQILMIVKPSGSNNDALEIRREQYYLLSMGNGDYAMFIRHCHNYFVYTLLA